MSYPIQIHEYIRNGSFAKDWYDEESKLIISLLPEFEGLPIIEFFAITSMTTSMEANVHLAIKALMQFKQGKKFTGFLPNQIMYLNYVIQNKPIPGRKIGNFIKALKGDPNAVVVDLWMCIAFELHRTRTLMRKRTSMREKVASTYYLAPSKKIYDKIEKDCFELAAKYNCEPRQIQSMIWCGLRKLKSKSNNQTWSSLLIRKKGMFSYEIN